MEKLVRDGLIQYIGVSNFSVKQMEEAQQALSREQLVSNQVEYSLLDRSAEAEILPFCKKEQVTVIAYSPLAQGRIPKGKGKSFKVLDEIAASLGNTRSQVALNWLLRHESVVTIPKAISQVHIRENATAFDWTLSVKQYEQLSQAFA